MAKQIPDDFVKQLRDIPIEEVASLYFDLKQMGSITQTSCIHGSDSGPSLTFFPTNTFYCFGCGAGKRPKTEGSDVISFVMWVDNCTFMEAVSKLANLKGLEVPKTGLSAEDKKKQQMFAEAVSQNRLYWEWLQKEERALEYLHGRWIETDDIAKWRIGYIPEDAKHYHKGKIVFSLMNDWGQTVGFSHRDMTKEFYNKPSEIAKYINSPKSLIFDKGSILYGLNFVKKQIREKGYVVVGEGFGDTILGQKLGLPFVSVMGTSMTDQHIAILKKYTNTVILWMDGDHGGITATLRHAKALRKEGFIVKVINYNGKDPDDIFADIIDNEGYGKEGRAYAEKLVETESLLASQYEIDRIVSHYESQLTELKIKTISQITPVLEEMDGVAERAFSKAMVARRMDVPPGDLGWEVKDEEA
jgi:DNA primase